MKPKKKKLAYLAQQAPKPGLHYRPGHTSISGNHAGRMTAKFLSLLVLQGHWLTTFSTRATVGTSSSDVLLTHLSPHS